MKRILTLDGGGIRGMFSLQVLARIEALFRAERGRPGLVLRDEFDFFAGTSTGAIIATFLAWGLSVGEIETLYVERGAEMFARAAWHQRWKSKFRADSIAHFFRERFCEDDDARSPAVLGTRKLWAGETPKYLLVVMRNASTGSPWPVTNNPCGKYNDPARADCNLRIPLWKLLRASTAAPTYFPPESIVLGDPDHPQLFVDGGVTPYNNPALIAALMATLPCYHIDWPTGPDRLQVVSVGTGHVRMRLKDKLAERIHLLDQATYVVPAIFDSVAREQDLMCRVLGDCVHGVKLENELGDLHGPGLLSAAEKKFSYVRYNYEYSRQELEDLLHTSRLQFTMDNLELIPYLQQTGRAYAANVRREHLFRSTPA
ncbi:MAG TPA: patatin-like phospholipase family protein [Opitutaceae bacterium]|nr:patatin-like phospholipase family protein [Opitutaceae bacterium]